MKMLILRGKAGNYPTPDGKPMFWPKGALDEPAALEFARLRGYDAKVIDVEGYSAVNSAQMVAALKEIRADEDIFALYGFSAGGYTIANILGVLTKKEKERLALVVILGAPPHSSVYDGPWELIYREDPPGKNGHMRGPRVLLTNPYGPTRSSPAAKHHA
jgi:hypothetical protein